MELPIEEVAARLGLAVARHVSLCPFHEDHHASLTYDRRRNRYHCFACGAHGQTIDLVRHQLHCDFPTACKWLADRSNVILEQWRPAPPAPPARVDVRWLSELMARPYLSPLACRFLYEERRLSPAVVRWCGISSIDCAMPMDSRPWGPCFDGPALLLPYRDVEGKLLSVQSRYLGGSSERSENTEHSERQRPNDQSVPDPNWLLKAEHSECQRPNGQSVPDPNWLCSRKDNGQSVPDPNWSRQRVPRFRVPRFRFPAGSRCGIFNLPVLRLLRPGEALYISEGVSDCLALLSAGHKAIAIPSATLLKPSDRSLLQGIDAEFHMFPDQDEPGEKLFLQLRALLPNMLRHPLPPSCKDYGEYWRRFSEPD